MTAKIFTDRVLKWLFFSACRFFSASSVTVLTGVRHINIPDSKTLNGCLLACNHQSFLDPVLVGMALNRPINYLARSQLFELPVFREIITWLGAHPVRQGGADRRALSTVIKLLRSGEPVLLFPEGTRTWDGTVGDFQPGIAALAGRCKVAVIPVCIEGAFLSWPRNRMLPVPARVAVMYGDPVWPGGKTKEEFTELLQDKIIQMQRRLKTITGR